MAPEVVKKDPYCTKSESDCWSIGVIAYALGLSLLTGWGTSFQNQRCRHIGVTILSVSEKEATQNLMKQIKDFKGEDDPIFKGAFDAPSSKTARQLRKNSLRVSFARIKMRDGQLLLTTYCSCFPMDEILKTPPYIQKIDKIRYNLYSFFGIKIF